MEKGEEEQEEEKEEVCNGIAHPKVKRERERMDWR